MPQGIVNAAPDAASAVSNLPLVKRAARPVPSVAVAKQLHGGRVSLGLDVTSEFAENLSSHGCLETGQHTHAQRTRTTQRTHTRAHPHTHRIGVVCARRAPQEETQQQEGGRAPAGADAHQKGRTRTSRGGLTKKKRDKNGARIYSTGCRKPVNYLPLVLSY